MDRRPYCERSICPSRPGRRRHLVHSRGGREAFLVRVRGAISRDDGGELRPAILLVADRSSSAVPGLIVGVPLNVGLIEEGCDIASDCRMRRRAGVLATFRLINCRLRDSATYLRLAS